MSRKLSRNEEYEQNLQRFVNNYKWKTKQEIIESTIEIKISSISEFEHRLLDCIRVRDISNYSTGMLVSMKIVLSRLIDNNSTAKDYLNERLCIVLDALEKK
jgi:hypothetical protein